jgi:hypothetical protein
VVGERASRAGCFSSSLYSRCYFVPLMMEYVPNCVHCTVPVSRAPSTAKVQTVCVFKRIQWEVTYTFHVPAVHACLQLWADYSIFVHEHLLYRFSVCDQSWRRAFYTVRYFDVLLIYGVIKICVYIKRESFIYIKDVPIFFGSRTASEIS